MPKKAVEVNALDVEQFCTTGMHFVGGVAGLALDLTPSGTKSWVLRVMVGTKRRKMGLGGYPEVSLDRARQLARHARLKISDGVDPIEERKAARRKLMASKNAGVTFRACAQQHIDAHMSSWTNVKHQGQWESTLQTYVYPLIGDLSVSEVEVEHVLQVIEPIWLTKTETASRVRGRIEAVLNTAILKGLRPGPNPAVWRGTLCALLPPARKESSKTPRIGVKSAAPGSPASP